MFFRLFALSYLFVSSTIALRVTPGSPCESRCGTITNTTENDIVCRDNEFSDTAAGSRFRDCVKCELQSKFEDRRSYQSDVKWGLYNLRYTFSTCIFGFPTMKQSLSTPCQVTCDFLKTSIEYQLVNPNPQSGYDFCGLNSFSDDFVTKCSLCYSYTEDEKIVGNFIEAIRQGCHSKVPAGSEFIIPADRIFNTTMLPPSEKSIAPPGTGKHSNKPLILIIVLPIVGFLILCLAGCFCCFFFIRHRRRKAQKESQENRLSDRWNDMSLTSPVPGGLRHTFTQPQVPQGHTYDYNPSFHQSYYTDDVKYPPETYQMAPMNGEVDETKKAAFVAPTVPTLSAPPPGRKSTAIEEK